MSAHLPYRAALLVFMVGAAAGCSAHRSARLPTAETKERRPLPGYTVDSKPVALSPGDTIAVWFVDDPPVRVEPVLTSIADDGTFRFGGGTFQVAGLTPEAAASKIQAQLVTNFIGPIFKVTVMRLQPNGSANGRQPFGPETNRTSLAAASRR